MKVSTAVAKRIEMILKERGITKYRLERMIAMPHNTMKSLMRGRNEGVNLKTVMLIIRGLNMTAAQFFDDPLFENPDLDVD